MHILAIEDHALFLDGLRHLLRALDDQLELSEASRREDAIALLERYQSDLDLIVLDLALPQTKPFELLRACRRLAPQAPVAVLSASEDRLEVQHALELGAQAYLFKSTPNAEILAALRRVMRGDIVWPQPITGVEARSRSREGISERQQMVLRLLARGLSNKEIAVQLGLTENTVKVHLAHCYRTLEVTTRTAAVRRAIRVGLIEDG